MIGIVARPAVAHPDVQIAVRPEHQVAAVVVRERLRDERRAATPLQIEAGRGVRDERIRRRSAEPRDHGVAGVDEEPSARRVRREREAEQPAFAARQHRAAEIQEVGVRREAAADRADASALLDDELDGAVGGILDERERRREAGGVDARAKRRRLSGERRRTGHGGGQRQSPRDTRGKCHRFDQSHRSKQILSATDAHRWTQMDKCKMQNTKCQKHRVCGISHEAAVFSNLLERLSVCIGVHPWQVRACVHLWPTISPTMWHDPAPARPRHARGGGGRVRRTHAAGAAGRRTGQLRERAVRLGPACRRRGGAGDISLRVLHRQRADRSDRSVVRQPALGGRLSLHVPPAVDVVRHAHAADCCVHRRRRHRTRKREIVVSYC